MKSRINAALQMRVENDGTYYEEVIYTTSQAKLENQGNQLSTTDLIKFIKNIKLILFRVGEEKCYLSR